MFESMSEEPTSSRDGPVAPGSTSEQRVSDSPAGPAGAEAAGSEQEAVPADDDNDRATDERLAAMSDHELVDEVAAAQAGAAAWYGQQIRAVAHLWSRPAMNPPATNPTATNPTAAPDSDPNSEAGTPRDQATPREQETSREQETPRERLRQPLSREDMVIAEISARLRINGAAAAHLLSRARILTARLTASLKQLCAGILDESRAGMIADTLNPVADWKYRTMRSRGASPEEAERAATDLVNRIEARILPRAPGQTLEQLRGALRRAIHALAGPFAEERRKARTRERDVFCDTHGRDEGMAFLGANLPVVEAKACYAELDSRARAQQDRGDQRTLSELRADVLVDLILNPGASSADSVHSIRVHGQDVARGVRAHVQITISAETLLGLTGHPAHLHGYGAITAELARAVALQPGSTWRRLITDPRSGALMDYGRRTYRPPVALADHVIARAVMCAHPCCRRPAEMCDVDHVVPYPLGPTSLRNLSPRCRRHHRLKHEGGWRVRASNDPADPAGTWITTSPTGHEYRHDLPDLRPEDDRPEDDRPEDDRPEDDRPEDDRGDPEAPPPY